MHSFSFVSLHAFTYYSSCILHSKSPPTSKHSTGHIFTVVMSGFHLEGGVGGSFSPKLPNSPPPKEKEKEREKGERESEREGNGREHILFGYYDTCK